MKKLKFDNEQLKFNEEKVTFWDYLKKGMWFFVASIGLALIYYVIFAVFFNTDEEKQMIRENKAIEAEYDKLSDKMDRLENVISTLQARDRQIYREIFNSDPPYFISATDESQLILEDDDTAIGNSLVRYTSLRLKSLEKSVLSSERVLTEIETSVKNSEDMMQYIPSIIPVAGFSIVQTGATLGRKIHPFYKTIVMHTGIDLIVPLGTDVYAAANGKVSQITKSEKGKGNFVRIDHENGYVTTYSHLADIRLRKGQKVKQGALVGRVGTSGTTFAPHLHYEVLLHGEYQDPVNYFFADLNPDMYREMMIIAVNTGQSMD